MDSATDVPELEAIARFWGHAYTFSHDPGRHYAARRRDGKGTIRAATPALLLDAIKDDAAARPLSRTQHDHARHRPHPTGPSKPENPPPTGQIMTTRTRTASAEPGSRRPGCGMPCPVSTEEVEAGDRVLAQARARHPQWSIWTSTASRYWATRMGRARLTERVHPGWAMTVDADSLPELETRLDAQSEYEQAPVPCPAAIRADPN